MYGGDIVSSLSKVSEKIGIPLKNWHLPGHKFTGPFTELDKRLDENDNPLPGYEPFNQVDEIAMKHDICYRDAEKNNKTRNDCDKDMLNNLSNMKTRNFREKVDYALVKPIIWTKYKLGLGIEEELHKPIRHKFKRRRVFVYHVDDIWSADLMDKQKLSIENKGYKYLLNIIDLFSKFAYSIPLKTKSEKEITEAFSKLFLNSKRIPKMLWTDQGKEFTSNKFKDFLKQHNIELYHVYNEGKACVIERFNRTLGEMIQKHLTRTKSKNYIKKLDELINEYNNRTHSTIKISPFEALKPENYNEVYDNINRDSNHRRYTVNRKETNMNIKPKFKVGDKVRISKYKNTFEKGSTENWTREIFTIDKVKNTNPVTYTIIDENNEPILGSFYNEELLKTKF